MCGRGLKLSILEARISDVNVARRVRAWIETPYFQMAGFLLVVARRVRAWIETKIPSISSPITSSRPPCAGVD